MNLPRVNLISNIFNPVGPSAPGGLEVFNYYLARELQNRGIDLCLMAAGDSEPLQCLNPIVPESIMFSKDEEFLAVPWNYRKMTMEEFAAYIKSMDNLISAGQLNHFSLVNFLPVYLAAKRNIPSILTMHMATDNYSYKVLFDLLTEEELNRVKFVGVSRDQVKEFAAPSEVIHNGVSLEDHAYSEGYRASFVWLARMVKGKGCEDAILAANKAGVTLELGGAPNSAEEHDYFKLAIAPELNDKINHAGYIDSDHKSNFLAAKALLFLPKMKESFGLTMIEAMACGTPVIAYNKGAVAEIVVDGETGFIVEEDNIEAVADAINKIDQLSESAYSDMRRRCRQHIEEKFSLQKMTDAYINLYQKVLAEK